ncbi:MAG: methyltransferase domain-containing protein [Microthrixaceae bacterium]
MSDATPLRNTYDKYDTPNPVERRLMAGFFSALDGALSDVDPERVLEVGAGEGEVTARVSELFPTVPVLGFDLPDDETRMHWNDRGVTGTFGDIHELPFPDGSFDLVLAIEVLEHVAYPEIALAEIERVTRSHLIASVPREPVWRMANLARGKYVTDLGNTPGHINHWTTRGFAGLIGRRFEVESVTHPFPWTMVRATLR